MTSLSDAHATGTEAGAKSFTYDANGNMTSDGRKGLDLRWNLLSLVDSAGMHSSSLTYAWLSDGTKVRAAVRNRRNRFMDKNMRTIIFNRKRCLTLMGWNAISLLGRRSFVAATIQDCVRR